MRAGMAYCEVKAGLGSLCVLGGAVRILQSTFKYIKERFVRAGGRVAEPQLREGTETELTPLLSPAYLFDGMYYS